jgi:hypothetical protein
MDRRTVTTKQPGTRCSVDVRHGSCTTCLPTSNSSFGTILSRDWRTDDYVLVNGLVAAIRRTTLVTTNRGNEIISYLS